MSEKNLRGPGVGLELESLEHLGDPQVEISQQSEDDRIKSERLRERQAVIDVGEQA